MSFDLDLDLDPCSCQRLVLPPGHVQAVHVPEGTELRLEQGRVEVSEPPRWLAEGMVMLRHSLRGGQRLRIGQRGWLCLSAPAEGPALRLALYRPQPLALRAWRRLCRAARPAGARLRALLGRCAAASPRP